MEILKGEGKFYIGDNENDPLAEITFVKTGEDKIIIDHTIVSDTLQGQGVAKKLLTRAVEFAREEKIKIIPVCPYVIAQFEKNPDLYGDVWFR